MRVCARGYLRGYMCYARMHIIIGLNKLHVHACVAIVSLEQYRSTIYFKSFCEYSFFGPTSLYHLTLPTPSAKIIADLVSS